MEAKKYEDAVTDAIVGPELLEEVQAAIIHKGYYVSLPLDGVVMTFTAPTADELVTAVTEATTSSEWVPLARYVPPTDDKK